MSDAERIAALEAALRERDRRIAELEALLTAALTRIAELEERLRQSSQNSSRPPSQDPPQVPPKRSSPKGRKRGGQPGHEGHQRALLPLAQVHEVVPCRPASCSHCQAPLSGNDPEPLRHQVAELPPITPHVTEYQLHRLSCPACHKTTLASLPHGTPTGAFGPRAMAFISLLTGKYRLAKRAVQDLLEDAFSLHVATGSVSHVEQTVSAALAAPVAEAREVVRAQAVANVDETGWREEKKKAWLWVVVTAAATVFQIVRSRAGAVAKDMLGAAFAGIVGTDRFRAYSFLRVGFRQLCWAHLLRDFQAMVERDARSAFYGGELLLAAKQMFLWWNRVRDGTLSREQFREWMKPVQERVGQLLRNGAACAPAKTAGVCAAILEWEASLWTFVREEGVEPTNNGAERALRPAVLWRRGSYGTESEEGSRYVERVMTVVATLKQQKRNVLSYLTEACRAHLRGQQAPSLLPQLTLPAALAA